MDNRKYSDPEVTMGEDVNITLPALLDCNRLVIMEDALYYHYFYHDKSMVQAQIIPAAGLCPGLPCAYHPAVFLVERLNPAILSGIKIR